MTAWMPPSFFSDDLRQLQSATGAPPNDAAQARSLLVAFGRCVVHDVPVDRPVGVSAEVAVLGAVAFTNELKQATSDGDASVRCWHDADSQFESDAVVAGLLELRMDAWYAAEALERLVEDSDSAAAVRLRTTLHSLDAAAHAYDVMLEENQDVLATSAGTPLLRNWRAMLPERHDPLPWWLDGTLEAAAMELHSEFEAAAGVFRRRRRADVIPFDRSVPVARASDMALRRASAALAASASQNIVVGLEWTLPGTPLKATLYVPPTLKNDGVLWLTLVDAAGGNAAFESVGCISFLNGNPVHWRLTGSSQRPEVTASLYWSGASQLTNEGSLRLVDGMTGTEWVAAIHDQSNGRRDARPH
jgi:hypothetical protein